MVMDELDSENGLLIATDVAARGLDIPNIKHIIHYQVPRSTEVTLHTCLIKSRSHSDSLPAVYPSKWANSSSDA